MNRRRLAVAYLVLFSISAVIALVAFHSGSGRDPQPSVDGVYALSDASCVPAKERLSLRQSGQFVNADGPGDVGGKLRLRDGKLTGTVTCADGSHRRLELTAPAAKKEKGESCEDRAEEKIKAAEDPAKAKLLTLRGTLGGESVSLAFKGTRPDVCSGIKAKKPAKPRSGEETFGRLMLAIAAVILAARLVRGVIGKVGQPPVMGEVLAGILLGPTLLGAVAPDVKNYLFPADIVPLLSAGAQIGLAFYMFLVGMELDPRMLRGRVGEAAIVSNASVVFPLSLGIAAAVPLYGVLAPDSQFAPFALFMGVSMAITAFPVLARILIERRMLKRPIGAMALSAAAIDDVTAWSLLALASAVAASGSGLGAVRVVGLAFVFCLAMAFIGRPLLQRVSAAYDEAGHVPGGWIAAIFVGVLLSAFVSQRIGIAAIFGAFVMGLIMPRRADLSHDVSRRMEDFVVTVLLPLFFVVTGLRTQVGLLDRPVLWLIALGLLALAIVGKWFGAMIAARFSGMSLRESSALGALMNTRGLTELIVLNIGLELGVITPALFTMLVLMALVTTFMTAPALRLIDRRGELSAPVEEELREARPEPEKPERSILVAPLDERNLDALLALAKPLAESRPPRELIVARLLPPSRSPTVLAPEERELTRATEELDRRRSELLAEGVATRVLAFTSSDPGKDLVRLASEQEVDLLLVDGRRPVLGEGVPRGDVGVVLEKAPCDVAVLVERERAPEIDADHPVVVPFGGDEHDWAALELGAWIAFARGAPLKLLGARPEAEDGDPSRLLGNASLVVQQLAGVVAEPVIADRGRDGIMRAAEGAGLLVIGLSERWRQEGLGPLRSAIARSAPAPTLFVRRGIRPGALAPRDDMTRFTWSSATGAPG